MCLFRHSHSRYILLTFSLWLTKLLKDYEVVMVRANFNRMLIRQPIFTSVLIRHSPWLRRFLRDLAWEVLEKHKLRSCLTQYLHFNAWLNASIFIWINQEKEKHTLADAAVYSHCPALLQKAVFLSQSCTTVRVSWHIQARLYTITHICKQIHTYLLCYPKKMQ